MGRTQDRTWRIGPNPETGLVDPEELVGEFAQLGWAMLRFGGAFVVVPERFRAPNGEWLTQAVNIRWESFVPPVEQRQHETLPGLGDDDLASLEGQFEPEPEPEETPAEEPEPVLE